MRGLSLGPPHPCISGDCPPGGAESQAFAGEVGKVDHTGSGEQVGEVALRSSTSCFASASWLAGQVADLAVHLGSGRPVEALPRRVLLGGAGLLQCEFVGVDRDDPASLPWRGARSGQAAQTTPVAARPPPAAPGTMGTLWAAGQVTVPALRSIVKASLAKPPVVLRTDGTFAITTWPAAVSRSRSYRRRRRSRPSRSTPRPARRRPARPPHRWYRWRSARRQRRGQRHSLQ